MTKDKIKAPRVECGRKQELIELSQLKPHPKNSNKHPESQISIFKQIILENGQRRPIVVSNLSGFITKGEGLYKTLMELGFTHGHVEYQDYENEALELADLEADNQLPELSYIDQQQRKANLKELSDLEDFNIEITGFTEYEIEEIMVDYDDFKVTGSAQPQKTETKKDDDQFAPEERFKPGQVWELGSDIQLFCIGDDVENYFDQIFKNPNCIVANMKITKKLVAYWELLNNDKAVLINEFE